MGPTTLMQAVAMAKGADPKAANTHRVSVIHVAANGSEVSRSYDLEAIRAGKQADPTIYPKDTVIVGGSGSKSFLQNLTGLSPLFYVFHGL
jgi:polysaccharide export outer membrane protein